MSLSDDKQADIIDAFNTTFRYLDDILNINNVYFDNIVSQIYHSELQLNKANTPDTEAACSYWSTETHRVLAKCLGFSNGTHRLLEKWRIDDSQNRYGTYFLIILRLFNHRRMWHMPQSTPHSVAFTSAVSLSP